MIKDLKINNYTIVMSIGPSCCGKSTYFLNNVNKILEDNLLSREEGVLISSDEIRADLLGTEEDRHSDKMCSVSKQAFSILYNEIDNFSQYPVNKKTIFVDTTGLSPDFRKKIREIAKKNNYSVQYLIFDYDDEQEYYDYRDNEIVRSHVKNLKKTKKLIESEAKEKGASVHYIKSKTDVNTISFNESNARSLIINDNNYAVVGDLHGSLLALKTMMPRLNQFKRIVLVGDIIDKGPLEDSEEILDLILKDDRFIWCKGNHEHFAKMHWQNKAHLDKEILNKYFNHAVNSSENFKKKVYEFCDKSYDWIETPTSIITHSPCENKYLKKDDINSIKQQRNLRYKIEGGETVLDKLKFLKEEDFKWHKTHIFGHIALEKPAIGKSYLGIDCGAVYGNALYATYYNEKNKKFDFISVKSKKLAEGNLHRI